MSRFLLIIIYFLSISTYAQILPSYQATHVKKHASSSSVTFTNCTATGKNGPTQSNCNTAYSGTTLDGDVTVSGGIQSWTVPSNGTYTIIAYGAQGGGDLGGKGAKISGQFSLSSGDVIKILVGQQGAAVGKDASGGGGTFVTKSPHNDNGSVIVIAGGGGGSWIDNSNTYGQTGTSGASGCCGAGYGGGYSGAGGSNGQGGTWQSSVSQDGGAGFLGDGITSGSYSSGRALAYVNGGTGGQNPWALNRAIGGFGGGGGSSRNHSSTYACAGGGGYSGGGIDYKYGANQVTGAGGGGSYNSGSSQSNTAGNNSGHGKVEISW